MGAQLDHLVVMARRPHVIVQVAPFGLAEFVPFRAFVTLLTFADRSVFGYTESAEEGNVVRHDETVRAWEKELPSAPGGSALEGCISGIDPQSPKGTSLMTDPNLSGAAWFKSSHSDNGGSCVEVSAQLSRRRPGP